jgi:hypothetical protein
MEDMNDYLFYTLWSFFIILILSIVGRKPVASTDREICTYTIAVAKKWLYKQRPFLGNGHNKHARNNRRAVGSGVFCAVRAKAI